MRSKPLTEIELRNWAADLAKLHTTDGYTPEQIAEVIAWLPTDLHEPNNRGWAGWAGVATRPAYLRQRQNGELRFEQILRDQRKAANPRGVSPTSTGRRREIELRLAEIERLISTGQVRRNTDEYFALLEEDERLRAELRNLPDNAPRLAVVN